MSDLIDRLKAYLSYPECTEAELVKEAASRITELEWEKADDQKMANSIIADYDNRIKELERDLNTCLRFMLPKDGEVWTKKGCGNGICSVGWSLGVGTHQIDESSGMSWGTIDQIACGCLVKEGDDG